MNDNKFQKGGNHNIYTFFYQWWIKIYAELDTRNGLNGIEKEFKIRANTFLFYPTKSPA